MDITTLIRRDFDLATKQATQDISEADLLDLLSDEVALMIERRLDFLLSMMYRLDIDEAKINRALAPGQPDAANIGLAKLILERQKQRIFTKATIKVSKLENDDVERW
jgi:hypothetical protein